MIISKKLEKMLNEQVGHEFGASMEYVNIAGYFEAGDMLFFAKIFFEQSDEERDHAMKLVHYLLEAGGTVVIPAIPAGKADFKSPEEAVAAALSWEETVTDQINNLMSIAVEDKDYISQNFLQWFVAEQLEEISKMSTILSIIKRAGDNMLVAEQYVRDVVTEMAAAEAGGE